MHGKIELELDKVEHYQKYPLMKPFVGENYFNSMKKCLFIAESHFFDMDEKKITAEYINSSPSKWYSSSLTDLHESKHNSINTRRVVNTSPHKLFSQLEQVLSLSMDKYNSKAINNIAFMNGFQRPSNKAGASIKRISSERDYQEGAKTIDAVVEIIKPEYVIFVSKFTWEKIGSLIKKVEGVNYKFTNHPASVYWNRKESPNSKYSLIKLLK